MDQEMVFDIPWRTLIDTAPSGLCVVDAKGTVRYANTTALNLLCLKVPDDAPAAEWLADLGDSNRDLLLEALKEGGQAHIFLPEAEIKHLVFETEPLASTNATLGHIRRDFEVEAAETMAILIHDLRLPMTAIMGYAKMLLTVGAESLSDMQRQFLDTIDRNVQRLEGDLSAAQEMTRVDRAKAKLTLTCLSPADVATEVLDELAPLAEEKGHHIVLCFPDEVPPVLADAERLARILHILLENALRYTPQGGEIRVDAGAAGDLVQINVADSGIGIPLAEQERVFSKFFRGQDERIREYHGLGLSLYIARGLTRLQGGQLWFESTPEQGSVFSFTLPIDSAA
jgi:signal transduction histidine kinase